MKPSIRRHRTEAGDLGEGWDLTRPPFGFATEPATTNHPSWRAARRALLGDAAASGGQLVERRDNYGLGLWSWTGLPSRRPRWIEASGS